MTKGRRRASALAAHRTCLLHIALHIAAAARDVLSDLTLDLHREHRALRERAA